MIDLNNRLLGDGSLSDDLSPALAICEQSGRDGVEEIVVTLRMAGSARNDAERARNFERALSELREQLQKKSRIDLKLGCGYEWLLSEDLPGRLDEFDRRPAINESNYLLLSFPSLVVPAGCERLIDEVISEGYVPIITHPECSRPVRDDGKGIRGKGG